MTIVNVQKSVKIAGNNRKYEKEDIWLKCDECNKQYVCHDKQKTRAKQSDYHFCSKECTGQSLKAGVLHQKATNTFFSKYGVENYMQTATFKNYVKHYCLDHYGVPSRLEAKEILEKIKQTNLKKYGRDTFAGSVAYEKKVDRKNIARKAWLTRLKKGNCITSKIENKFYDFLCENFGVSAIVRQIEIINQQIDFFIKPLNIYIQFDGEYWHGINKPLSKVRANKTAQGKSIYAQYLRDRRLDKYMRKHNKILLRITDKQFKRLGSTELLNIITKKEK